MAKHNIWEFYSLLLTLWIFCCQCNSAQSAAHHVIYGLICLQTVDCNAMIVTSTVAVLLDYILKAVGIMGCWKFRARLNMILMSSPVSVMSWNSWSIENSVWLWFTVLLCLCQCDPHSDIQALTIISGDLITARRPKIKGVNTPRTQWKSNHPNHIWKRVWPHC